MKTKFERCQSLARAYRDAERAGIVLDGELDVEIEQALIDAGFEVIRTDPIESICHFEEGAASILYVTLESGFTIEIPTGE